ncbi:MerR family transcriptional regulator [Rickettsiaceae bacterium]|nr:MerR family transcriptional regulator [Rickettsiaceae bacterium]
MIRAKKYFSIAETSNLSGLAAHKLRYIEKADPNITITQMRGRRYYTQEDINYIKNTYSTTTPETSNQAIEIIAKIDRLLAALRQFTA